MREIKCRAWLNEKKEMIYGLDYHSYDEGYFVSNSRVYRSYWDYSDNCKCSYEIDDCEVLQFTGLKDKNGVEIFEGDIVRVTDWPYLPNSQEKDLSAPFYKNEQVIYEAPQFNLGGWLNFNSEEKYEVIGNIYQHPELLK